MVDREQPWSCQTGDETGSKQETKHGDKTDLSLANGCRWEHVAVSNFSSNCHISGRDVEPVALRMLPSPNPVSVAGHIS